MSSGFPLQRRYFSSLNLLVFPLSQDTDSAGEFKKEVKPYNQEWGEKRLAGISRASSNSWSWDSSHKPKR
jgi:hypothetical protein